jgi:hypothetical protein
VFDRSTDRHAECKQQDLAPRIKCCTKDNITYWPSVFKSLEDENELRGGVDGDTHNRLHDVDNKESNGLENENPKSCLRVAMAIKKEAPKTGRQDIRNS